MSPHLHYAAPFELRFLHATAAACYYQAFDLVKPVVIARINIEPEMVGASLIASAAPASWLEHEDRWELKPVALAPLAPLPTLTSPQVVKARSLASSPSYLDKVQAWIEINQPTASALTTNSAALQTALAVMGVSRVAKLLGWSNVAVQTYVAQTMPSFDAAARLALKHKVLGMTPQPFMLAAKTSKAILFLDPALRQAALLAMATANKAGQKLAQQAFYFTTWITAHDAQWSALATNDQLLTDTAAMLGFEATRQLLDLPDTNAVRQLLFTRTGTRQRSFYRKLQIMLMIHSAHFLNAPLTSGPTLVPPALFNSFAAHNNLPPLLARRLFYSHGMRVAKVTSERNAQRNAQFAERYAALLDQGFKVYNEHYLVSCEGIVFKAVAATATLRRVSIITRTNNRGKVSLCVSVGHGHVSYLVRIVAELFVPNPNQFRYVTLIDNDYLNCHAKNIMWIESPSDGRFVEHRDEKWIDWIIAHYPADGLPLETLAAQLATLARAANFHAASTNLALRIQTMIYHWAHNGDHSLFQFDKSAANLVYLVPSQLARYRTEHWKSRASAPARV